MRYRIILILMCTYSISLSNHFISVGDDFLSKALNNELEYFEDSTTNMSFQQVRDENFKDLQVAVPNFGFTSSAYWFRFTVQNNIEKDLKLIIDPANHYLEYIHVYCLSEDGTIIKHIESGSKTGKVGCYYFNLPEDSVYTFYLRIQSRTPVRLPLTLYTEEGLTVRRGQRFLFIGVFYGVCAYLFLFSLFAYVFLRDKLYLYYIFTLISLVMFSLGYDNLIPEIPWSAPKDFVWLRFTATIPLIAFFYILFSESFFSFKEEIPVVRWILGVLKIIAIMLFLLYMALYYTGNRLGFFFVPLVGIILIFISVYLLLYKKYSHLRFYVIANLFFVLSVVIHVLSNSGIIHSLWLTQYALKAGYLIQLIVFSLAVIDRYFMFQKRFTEILEEKVEERTGELENALNKLKIRQKQLVQSEKMASLGTLTAGVAHELNNPLNYIVGGINIIENIGEDHAFQQSEEKLRLNLALSMMKEGIDKAVSIIKSLMSFSIRGKSIPKKADIHKIIDSTVLFLKNKLDDQIIIEKEYHFEGQIEVYPDKIHQVFLNILDNAIYAIKSKESSNKERIVISTNLQKDNNEKYAVIKIFNTGPGIDEKDINKIFDTFFTTKDPGSGTGLGLSISYSIVREHSGEIKVENKCDGVEFSLLLPLDVFLKNDDIKQQLI